LAVKRPGKKLQIEVLSTLASFGTDAALLVDAERRLVWASPNAAAVLWRQPPAGKRTPGSLAEGTPLALVLDDPHAAEVVGAALDGGQVQRGEVSQDGWRRVLRAVAAPITGKLGQGGEPLALLILSDMTHERRLSQAHQDLIANLSHDLRTPLASLSLLAETLNGEARGDPEATRVFATRIAAEADRLGGLVSGILDLARLEAGAEQAQLESVELLGLARQVADELAPQAKGRQLEMRVEGEEQLAQADPTRLARALSNVLDNAIKFTEPEGTVIVNVRLLGDAPVISVRDTGAGISPTRLPRIFDRFYTGDRSRSGSGSGLGLTIARQAVELQGGQITVLSDPGTGTIVEIRLRPAQDGSDPPVV
jgi:two-component system phosphate regulon sensor histidine kinase PhoR